MPDLTIKKTRPVWYNLSPANLPVPGLVSIFHRISGVLLFLAAIPAGLAALGATPREAYLRALSCDPAYGGQGLPHVVACALEEYFIGQARPWERYAWLKGRVLNGPGEAVAELARPFVYRRYLDFGVYQSLREMKGNKWIEA